ncbi:MAG: hypothetical protein ABI186_08065 [Candidatus Elarobacter sp.]
MQLFPERDRRGRRYVVIAVVLSLIVHLAGGALWPLFARTARPDSSERMLAKLEPITIEPLPRPTPRPTPTPAPPVAHGRPAPAKRAAAVPATRPLAMPAYALPTYAPRAEPTPPARKATVHIPRSVKVAQVPAPRGARAYAPTGGALSERQIAALDSTFRKTIDQAQAAAAAPPADAQPPVQTMKRYDKLLDGSVTDVEGGDGMCDPLDNGTTRGAYTYYYLRCNVHYADGFSEQVSFPWPFRFTRREDPFAMGPGRHEFPPQPPPAGFTLPHPFALSRAICAYYHDDCVAVLRREQAAGGAAP